MSPNSPVFIITQLFYLLSGLALFLHGMGSMSEGLQQAAGVGLRRNLQRATASKKRAFPLGALIGSMIHSSAGSVMLIGFISAGLVSFAQSIPVILGINVGTTLSMLMISFQLGDACWLAICIGLSLKVFPKTRAAGIALFGFGLIFLGLGMMSDAIYPFRETLSPVLQYSDGHTVHGMLIGVVASMLFTAIIQSSGATIGMVFAMLTAGAMHSFEQAYPVIIGASIGTCITAIIGSLRSTVEAKRCALTHLLFNVFTTLFAMLTAPIMYRLIPYATLGSVAGEVTPRMLVMQCAIANVIRMILGAMIILPFSQRVSQIIKVMLPDRGQSASVSHLDEDLLDCPEDACLAVMRELHRMVALCVSRFGYLPQVLLRRDSAARSAMRETDFAVKAVRDAIQAYLLQLAQYRLTRRQNAIVSSLYNQIDHVARIADHIGVLGDFLYQRHHSPQAIFPENVIVSLLLLYTHTVDTLQHLLEVVQPMNPDKDVAAEELRKKYATFEALATREYQTLSEEITRHVCPPQSAVYRNRYITDLRRIIKHVKVLSEEVTTPHFQIKDKKIGKQAKKKPGVGTS